jgi:hypothetical protein
VWWGDDPADHPAQGPAALQHTARSVEGRDLSWCSAWEPQGTGEAVWSPLAGTSELDLAPTTTMHTVHDEDVPATVTSWVLVPHGAEGSWSSVSAKVVFGAAGQEHKRYWGGGEQARRAAVGVPGVPNVQHLRRALLCQVVHAPGLDSGRPNVPSWALVD